MGCVFLNDAVPMCVYIYTHDYRMFMYNIRIHNMYVYHRYFSLCVIYIYMQLCVHVHAACFCMLFIWMWRICVPRIPCFFWQRTLPLLGEAPHASAQLDARTGTNTFPEDLLKLV